MEKKVTDIFTVEEWFCFVIKKNVLIKTAGNGARQCLNYEECIRRRGKCRNNYISIPQLYHKNSAE